MSGLQIIGAGFGRTGTSSLKLALERLGVRPVYHMETVFSHPWHAHAWRQAYRDQLARALDPAPPASSAAPARFAWEAALRGRAAAIDWPACTFYAEMAARCPRAKVILTVRDSPSWYESVNRTIYAVMRGFPFDRLGRMLPLFGGLGPMLDELIWDGAFGGRFEDRTHAIAVYERHNAAVIAAISPERLLVFDVRDGWEPLCAFLGAPAPPEPFPHANDRRAYWRKVRLLTLGWRRNK